MGSLAVMSGPGLEVRLTANNGYWLRRQSVIFSRFMGHALEEARAQIDTVGQHQQGNEQAGRPEKHDLFENLDLVDGSNGARKRPCDSSHP